MTILARTVGVWTWGLGRRPARRLHAFALAEHGSMIDLRLAARRCEVPERAARYLEHAADEARHARMFARRAAGLARRAGGPPLPPARADTERLFERLGEVDFLAFVHRGERRGRAQFEVYEASFARRGDARTAALFAAVIEDERRHEAYSRALLEELAGSPAAARRALRKMALWEAWRVYRRLGRAVATRLYTAAMILTYALSAPLALLVRVARPTRRGWHLAPGHRPDDERPDEAR